MKMNVLQMLILNHKVTAFALGALLTTAVGSAVSANIPTDTQPQNQMGVELQSRSTSINTETNHALIQPATDTTTEYTIEITTPATEQETTPIAEQETTPIAEQETTPATTTDPIPEISEDSPVQTTVTETTKETIKETTKATTPVATTVATTASPTVPQTETTTAPPVSLGDQSGTFDSTMAQAVLDKVNEERTLAGLGTLSWNDTLAASAKIRAAEIVVQWSHTRPDGTPWYTAGAQMQMGENLAYGQITAEQAMVEWMASQGHKDNILRTSFTTIGIASYYCNGVYYWVQHFA